MCTDPWLLFLGETCAYCTQREHKLGWTDVLISSMCIFKCTLWESWLHVLVSARLRQCRPQACLRPHYVLVKISSPEMAETWNLQEPQCHQLYFIYLLAVLYFSLSSGKITYVYRGYLLHFIQNTYLLIKMLQEKTTKRKFNSLEIDYILKFLRALPSSLLFLRTLVYSLIENSSSARL